jgi:hypothetical protein
MSEIVPVSVQRHGKKTLLPLTSYAFASAQNLVPLVASEFSVAAHRFPIVFVKQKEDYGVFALLGLARGQNLFVDASGRWLADYVPATLRRYPFVFATAENTEEYVLCIDETSGLLADSGGAPLFTAEGEKEPALEKALAFVSDYQKSALVSKNLCDALVEYELTAPLKLQLQTGKDKAVKIEGLLRIDEQKLNALEAEKFLALRTRGLLPLIYAHLFSLANLQGLGNRIKALAAAQTEKEKTMPSTFKF